MMYSPRYIILFVLLALIATLVASQDSSAAAAAASSAVITGNPAAQSNNPGGAGQGDFGGAAPDNATATLDTTISSLASAAPTAADQDAGTGGGAGSGDTGGSAPSSASTLWIGNSYVAMAVGPLVVAGLFATLLL